MGFIMHFYIIFGTNLLTGGPVQIAEKEYQTEPNGMKPLRGSFLEQTQSRRLGVDIKEATRFPRGRRARPHPHGPLMAPLTDLLRLYISTYPKNI